MLGLGLIVRALADHGLGELVDRRPPAGRSLLPLLGAALLAALLANLLNNVPALLLLLPAAAAAGPETVLAVLIGVNCGPNLTYTGSLATLLWRGVLRERGEEPDHGEFHRLGALTRAADPDRRYGRAVARDVKLVAWITEASWEACVDARRTRTPRPRSR